MLWSLLLSLLQFLCSIFNGNLKNFVFEIYGFRTKLEADGLLNRIETTYVLDQFEYKLDYVWSVGTYVAK